MNDELKAAVEKVNRLLELRSDARSRAACELADAVLAHIAADEANSERLAVPRGRLMAWIHNYGDQKQPEFIADLKAVLGMEGGR